MKHFKIITLGLVLSSFSLKAQSGKDSIPTVKPELTDSSMVKIPKEESNMPIIDPENIPDQQQPGKTNSKKESKKQKIYRKREF